MLYRVSIRQLPSALTFPPPHLPSAAAVTRGRRADASGMGGALALSLSLSCHCCSAYLCLPVRECCVRPCLSGITPLHLLWVGDDGVAGPNVSLVARPCSVPRHRGDRALLISLAGAEPRYSPCSRDYRGIATGRVRRRRAASAQKGRMTMCRNDGRRPMM